MPWLEKMLTYATGRGLQYYDRCAVDDIIKNMRKSENRFSALVTEIVLSEPFRKKRGDGGPAMKRFAKKNIPEGRWTEHGIACAGGDATDN